MSMAGVAGHEGEFGRCFVFTSWVELIRCVSWQRESFDVQVLLFPGTAVRSMFYVFLV